MNDNSLKLPKFKYHPNVYDKEKVLDAVQFDNNVCQCCGNKTDVYVSTMYCSGEVDCICMECVQMVRQQKSMMVNLSNTQRKYQMRRKGLNCLGEHRDIVLGKANIGWHVAMTIVSI